MGLMHENTANTLDDKYSTLDVERKHGGMHDEGKTVTVMVQVEGGGTLYDMVDKKVAGNEIVVATMN